jgi:hypothetical protein
MIQAATATANGEYWAINDPNNAAMAQAWINPATEPSKSYSFLAVVKKGTVPGKIANIILWTGVRNVIYFDLATGAFAKGNFNTYPVDDGGVLDGGEDWIVWATAKTPPTNPSSAIFAFTPASGEGTPPSEIAASTGSADVHDLITIQGPWTGLGPYMLRGRLGQFGKTVADLLKSVTEKGSDINGGLTDSAAGNAVVSRDKILTALGTSAGIVGQGALATLNSVLWANQVTGDGKPSDYAGTVVTPVANPKVTIIGNMITKSAPAGWDTGARTLEPISGAGVVRFRANMESGGLWMFGLVLNPDAPIANSGDVENNISYGVYKYAATSLRAIGGGYWPTFSGVADNNTIISIVYDGIFVTCWAGFTLLKTFNVGPGKILYPRFFPYTSGMFVRDLFIARQTELTDINRNVYDLGSGNYNAVLRTDLKTPLGTAAGIINQGVLATLNSVNMDAYVADGTVYARIRADQLSGGVPKLSVAGSGVQIGDGRNLPPIIGAGGRYQFVGAVTYSATSSSATISVAAGTLYMGDVALSYNGMSVGVTGTAGTSRTFYLYVDANQYSSGAHTLKQTTNGIDIYNSSSRIWVGTCTVAFPASGSGTGGGFGGGGFGGGSAGGSGGGVNQGIP